jgi:lipase (class 3)
MSFLTKLPAELYNPDAFKQFSGGSDFDIGNARAMAWMSQLAYETDEPEKIAKILQSFGLALVEGGVLVEESKTVLPKASTHCFVASHPMAVIVAFAGTDPVSLANWISDFDAHLDVTTGTAEGYEEAADVVWSELKQLLQRCVPPGGKVLVTGHSLGGALAALIANRDRHRVAGRRRRRLHLRHAAPGQQGVCGSIQSTVGDAHLSAGARRRYRADRRTHFVWFQASWAGSALRTTGQVR